MSECKAEAVRMAALADRERLLDALDALLTGPVVGMAGRAETVLVARVQAGPPPECSCPRCHRLCTHDADALPGWWTAYRTWQVDTSGDWPTKLAECVAAASQTLFDMRTDWAREDGQEGNE